MTRLVLALAVPLLLALGQQQLLLRQPPRLQQLQTSESSSGPASLDLRFSRPMDRASVASASRLDPPLALRWLGSGDRLKLALESGSRIDGPIRLTLAGRDRRGLPLKPSRWLWDPRPRIVAAVPVRGGEQLQLQQADGRWQSISPVWPQILALEALGDGSGVAVVSRTQEGQQIWRIPLQQRNLAPADRALAPVRAAPPIPLGDGRALFAHLSSNRRGDLLVQSGGPEPMSVQTLLWPRGMGPQTLPFEASGPLRLLPQGGAVVVPTSEGLTLQDLPPRPPRQQILPGSRDLSSFCPRDGRALLVRHWPDFRRSLELVEPGQPPRQLWLGSQALVASSCQGSGERLWLALIEGSQRPELTLLALDRAGRLQRRRILRDWELEPGTTISLDPSRNQLLLVLRRLRLGTARPQPPQVVVLHGDSLEPQLMGQQGRLAVWLPP
ncbi:MAG: hypothetical protein VKM98_01795 [Cyanobacteriota bacterium]|nr:hypothetical protein [Cyanobacteriota bacterium]